MSLHPGRVHSGFVRHAQRLSGSTDLVVAARALSRLHRGSHGGPPSTSMTSTCMAGTAAPCRRTVVATASAAHGGHASQSVSGPTTAAVLPRELRIRVPEACRVPCATLPFLRQVLEHYAARTPRLHTIIDRVMRPGWPEAAELGHDHFAFRTFGVPGLGIASLERVLQPLGYSRVAQQPPLAFPGKKLLAAWFTPTDPRVRATLPRIFVSEIQVEKLSGGAQEIIRRATAWAAEVGPDAATVQVLTSLLTGTSPWPTPSLEEYEALLSESEYAAWVLAHGYSLNHTALALHRLPPVGRGADITGFVGRLQSEGLELNPEGGIVKVSPDGLLLQCAVLADVAPFSFACGQTRAIPAAYVEFVQRLRLPKFATLKDEDVREEHLREGFEVGNADRIFASTTLAAAARE